MSLVEPEPREPAPPVPGLLDGALSLPRGFGFLLRTRAAWLPAAVPALVLLSLFSVLAVVAVREGTPLLLSVLAEPGSTDTWWARWGLSALRFVASALLVLASAIVAAWLTPPLSGPALERIVLLRERELGAPARPPVSFLAELWCGLRAQLLGLVVGGPVLATLWLGLTLFPPAAVVLLPLKLLVVAALLSWGLLDYPLSLRGVPLRRRLALLRSAAPAVLGFGAVVAALFMVPLAPILLLPAGVAAATEIAVRLTPGAGSSGRLAS